jgi:hypothetical protein
MHNSLGRRRLAVGCGRGAAGLAVILTPAIAKHLVLYIFVYHTFRIIVVRLLMRTSRKQSYSRKPNRITLLNKSVVPHFSYRTIVVRLLVRTSRKQS